MHTNHVHVTADKPEKEKWSFIPNRRDMRRKKLMINNHTAKGFIRKSGRKLTPASLYTHFVQEWTNKENKKRHTRLPRTILLNEGAK